MISSSPAPRDLSPGYMSRYLPTLNGSSIGTVWPSASTWVGLTLSSSMLCHVCVACFPLSSLWRMVFQICKLSLRLISLAFTSCAVIIIGVVPSVANDYIAILPILFVTPVQWNAFREANGYISATIFSTNNLRQATTSLASYLIDRDEKQRDKAKFFWSTLASFHMGVALSCVSSLVLGVESIWFCFIPIMLSATAYVRLEQKNIGFIRKNVSKAEKTI